MGWDEMRRGEIIEEKKRRGEGGWGRTVLEENNWERYDSLKNGQRVRKGHA